MLRRPVAYSTRYSRIAPRGRSRLEQGALPGRSDLQQLASPKLHVEPLGVNVSLRVLAYDALKKAIMDMDIYGAAAP